MTEYQQRLYASTYVLGGVAVMKRKAYVQLRQHNATYSYIFLIVDSNEMQLNISLVSAC